MHSSPDLNENIYNFIHTILIKTINNDTLKQYVETTVLVHDFNGNGNTLINSQPSSERFEVYPSVMLVICLVINTWQLYIL